MNTKTTNWHYLPALLLISLVHATNLPLDSEESSVANTDKDQLAQDYFLNDEGQLVEAEDIKLLKQAYISPYNYIEDPIALRMGYDSRTESSSGTYHGGTSFIMGQNNLPDSKNSYINTDIAEIWGQTGRLGGFAIGGSATAVVNFNQPYQSTAIGTTGVLAPSQAYIDYQYPRAFEIIGGNILITTPWVNSFTSVPGASYAMSNNTYQGVMVNIQALPSLLFTGFTAWGYLQYPNFWPNQQTMYNTQPGQLSGITQTSDYGPSGVGLTWNPVNSYSGRLWLYNFSNYANMAYLDNSYHVHMSDLFSFDFGLQAFTQASSGSSITNQVYLPGQTSSTAGLVSSNGTGAKIALNIGNNTTGVSFNNIFGSGFLNGGMVTPYTYGMRSDPLYTTPALNSLAELGSGYAYTIRNTTQFMDSKLKFNLSASQFDINQVYATQASLVNEFDASLIYQIPHTTMNVWTRLVYVQQPSASGGDMLQPRLIYNWTF